MLCCICCPWGQGRARVRAHMAGVPPCTASGAAMALLWSPLPSCKTPSTSTGDPYPLLALLPSTPFGGSGSVPHYRASPLPCAALPCPALPCPALPLLSTISIWTKTHCLILLHSIDAACSALLSSTPAASPPFHILDRRNMKAAGSSFPQVA